MESSGLTPTELSRRLGKSRSYISSFFTHDRSLRAETLSRIAHECGFRLVLERDGSKVEVYSEEDLERRLRSRLEDVGPHNAEGPSTQPAKPSIDDVVEAYREGRLSIRERGSRRGQSPE